MNRLSVGELLEKLHSSPKIKKSQYCEKGAYPIVDQSQSFIAGYTDDTSWLYTGDLPVVVFGDHTRVLKLVNFPFCIGVDGTQILRPKKNIDIRYFYYSLKNIDLSNYGYERHFKYLKESVIELPLFFIQKKIAAILSAYDDLIENNLRRIKTLEEMAQNLYREWFVNFRFPGDENTRFVDSSLGKIPEGWEVVKVGDLLDKIKRVTKVPKSSYTIDGFYPVIDQGKDFIGGYTDHQESVISSDLPLIVFGDHTRILKYIDFPFARGADGTQLLKSNNERMPMSLFYYSLLAIDLSSYAYARHFKFLKDEKILLPDSETAEAFDKFLLPTLDNIKILMKKINILRQTRDLLLPKLISGEVDVSELDIKVPEEAAS